MLHNFQKAIKLVLAHEGGWSNHPKDPGGATNFGVTQRVYDAFRRNRNRPQMSVRYIEESEVYAIYRLQYWDRVRADELPLGLDYAVFDFAVNSGVSRGAKAMQTLLGVKPDGVIGEVTLAALRGMERHEVYDLIVALCDDRLAFLKRLRNWPTFGRGWQRRVMGDRLGAQEGDYGVIDHAAAMCGSAPAIKSLPAVIGSKPGEAKGEATGPLRRSCALADLFRRAA